ncbi:MAG: hypothetical protein AAF441_23595 [Pseudomonadota bacterium]
MTNPPDIAWEEVDHDAASGRRIFKAEEEVAPSGNYGTYQFKTAARFEVRNADGEVLFKTSGSASGEHWCGVFLWFVEGSEGRRVRLDESDTESDEFFDVPDTP